MFKAMQATISHVATFWGEMKKTSMTCMKLIMNSPQHVYLDDDILTSLLLLNLSGSSQILNDYISHSSYFNNLRLII